MRPFWALQLVVAGALALAGGGCGRSDITIRHDGAAGADAPASTGGSGATASGGSGMGGSSGRGAAPTGGTATGGSLTGGTATGGTATGGVPTGGTSGLAGTGGADAGTAGCATDCSATSCGTGLRPVCDPTVQQCVCDEDCAANPGTCGAIEHCPSVCAPSGVCVCRGSCGTEGQIGFFPGCCPGLVEVTYFKDTTSCTSLGLGGERLVVCTACGDQICGLGENRCNCPQDCQ